MYPKRKIPIGSTLLQVSNLSTAGDRVRNVSFEVRRGEIVAVFGLLGAGQSELARALFGAIPITSGTVLLDGSPVNLSSTTAARKAGMGLVPEDRKTGGLVSQLSVKTNLTLAALPRYARSGLVDTKLEEREAAMWADRLNVKRASMSQQIRFLSGGNQQKVIIARWLANQSKVLVLDQPTRGVDVGAKVEIYRLLEDLCDQGVGVVIISIEMPEVLGIADRVYVMCEGRLVGPYSRAEATKHKLMSCAVGIEGEGTA
jgi:ABC-type sugar transport system ATPase subunit